ELVRMNAERTEGIFRISGHYAVAVAIWASCASGNGRDVNFHPPKPPKMKEEEFKVSVHEVAAALKHYLRQSPDPLIPYAMREKFEYVMREEKEGVKSSEEVVKKQIHELQKLVRSEALDFPEDHR